MERVALPWLIRKGTVGVFGCVLLRMAVITYVLSLVDLGCFVVSFVLLFRCF